MADLYSALLGIPSQEEYITSDPYAIGAKSVASWQMPQPTNNTEAFLMPLIQQGLTGYLTGQAKQNVAQNVYEDARELPLIKQTYALPGGEIGPMTQAQSQQADFIQSLLSGDYSGQEAPEDYNYQKAKQDIAMVQLAKKTADEKVKADAKTKDALDATMLEKFLAIPDPNGPISVGGHRYSPDLGLARAAGLKATLGRAPKEDLDPLYPSAEGQEIISGLMGEQGVAEDLSDYAVGNWNKDQFGFYEKISKDTRIGRKDSEKLKAEREKRRRETRERTISELVVADPRISTSTEDAKKIREKKRELETFLTTMKGLEKGGTLEFFGKGAVYEQIYRPAIESAIKATLRVDRLTAQEKAPLENIPPASLTKGGVISVLKNALTRRSREDFLNILEEMVEQRFYQSIGNADGLLSPYLFRQGKYSPEYMQEYMARKDINMGYLIEKFGGKEKLLRTMSEEEILQRFGFSAAQIQQRKAQLGIQ